MDIQGSLVTYSNIVREVQHIVKDIFHKEHQTEKECQHSNSNGKIAAVVISIIETWYCTLICHTTKYNNGTKLKWKEKMLTHIPSKSPFYRHKVFLMLWARTFYYFRCRKLYQSYITFSCKINTHLIGTCGSTLCFNTIQDNRNLKHFNARSLRKELFIVEPFIQKSRTNVFTDNNRQPNHH